MTTNTVPTSSAPTDFDAGPPSVSTCDHLELEPSRHRDAVEDRDDESVGLMAKMDDRWIGEVINAARRGGFSLHDRIGDAPRSGYMVSITPQNIKHISHINADHFRNFVMHHRHLLADHSLYELCLGRRNPYQHLRFRLRVTRTVDEFLVLCYLVRQRDAGIERQLLAL